MYKKKYFEKYFLNDSLEITFKWILEFWKRFLNFFF